MAPLSVQSSEFLVAYLNERVQHLHSSIRLREGDGTAALASLIKKYIDLVPDFIAAFEDFLRAANVNGEIARQLVTAREFLDVPIDIMSAEEGLEASMYQAYLAHRLLEELNDTLSVQFNCAVIPVNMTRSNLIVHHIIGEPFANQIDSAIQLLNDKLIASLKTNPELSIKLLEYTSSLGKDPSERFPCLTESSNIRLLFKSQNSRVRLN
jgi:hypothetical protein